MSERKIKKLSREKYLVSSHGWVLPNTYADGLAAIAKEQKNNKKEIMQWCITNKITKWTKEQFINEHDNWLQEKRSNIFKHGVLKQIILKNKKIVDEIFQIRKSIIKNAIKEAEILVSKQ